ncbi:MAG TPA: WGxxGxxG family protein [Gemmatimonadaceae bacterium]|nr:WGxxGxxG family protein [Gemmatimonadaceae bacterium]
MREFEFRRFFQGAALVAGLTVAGATVPAAVQAQTPSDPAATQTMPDYDDDDQDWGWVGLLGLAGLLGLRRRDRHDRHDHVDTTTRRP